MDFLPHPQSHVAEITNSSYSRKIRNFEEKKAFKALFKQQKQHGSV
jgi:hypothetical protein